MNPTRNHLLRTVLLAGGAVALLVSGTTAPRAAERLTTRDVATPFQRAGVLGGTNAYDDFGFRAAGGSVLFATASSNYYQTSGRRPGEEECGGDEPSTTSAGGGDEGEDPGKALLCLQILDPAGAVLCFAERPAQPGWQRDPRLACALAGDPAATMNYTLRVSFADQDCGDKSYPEAPTHKDGSPVSTPYLLDGSLQPITDDGPLF